MAVLESLDHRSVSPTAARLRPQQWAVRISARGGLVLAAILLGLAAFSGRPARREETAAPSPARCSGSAGTGCLGRIRASAPATGRTPPVRRPRGPAPFPPPSES